MPPSVLDRWRGWCSVMLESKLLELARQNAGQTLGLRMGVVGVNLAVMLGLAWLLGFETFGRLAALWGTSLVVGCVLSLGGPVILLRMLTDGKGMRGRDICKVCVVYPAALALVIGLVASVVWPIWPWTPVLCAGFFANALGCLASVMRALGSVQVSMLVRDGGPQVALGFAGVFTQGAGAGAVLMVCAILMAAIGIAGGLWVLRHRRMPSISSVAARPVWNMSLWAASVLGMIVAQIDLVMGSTVISAEQLGVYAVLRRLANLVALPVTVATWVSAPAVSAAHGAADTKALARASAQGSKIAMLPGAVLFGIGVMALPFMPLVLPYMAGVGSAVVLVLLLLGALGQVVFTSSFTVATLCEMPSLAMRARLLMVVLYLLWFQWWSAELTMVLNALGYVGALTLGGAMLWWAIWRQLGVDTSAAVLLRAKGGQWKTS